MKYTIIFILGCMLALPGYAQLYSSGNNVIAGNNVGIGISTPSPNKLHVKGSGATYSVIQSDATNATAALRIQDASGAANELGLSKYGPTVGGTFMGISRNNMAAINSLTGSFVINAGGKMIFGSSMTVAPFTQTPRFIIDSFGKINIGANSDFITLGSSSVTPVEKVHIVSNNANSNLRISNSTTGNTANDGMLISTAGNVASIINKENSSLNFGTNNLNRMSILANGSVMIGSTNTPAGYMLYVETGILSEKVKVAIKNTGEWSDYVFAEDYKLSSLPEVEAYIKEHKHLPGVPSAQEVVDNGIDVAKMDAKLLEKVEELTLQLIEMDKKLQEVQKRLDISEGKK